MWCVDTWLSRARRLALGIGLLATSVGCGAPADALHDDATTSAEETGATTGAPATDGTSIAGDETTTGEDGGDTSSPTSTDDGGDTSSGSDGGELPWPTSCHDAPPVGAQAPPPVPAYSGGVCPPLLPGDNTLSSLGHTRSFILVAPRDIAAGERLPLLFLWHWLGGDAEGFIEKGDVQRAADELRFIAIAPRAKGDLLFRWPFTTVDTPGRIEEEQIFFDDMLSCASDNFDIATSCVSSVGVSAGALWTTLLASGRGHYLSSFVSLSGGSGNGGIVQPWGGATHVMPALVLWGGRQDTCIAVDFQHTSGDLEANLVADGHPLVECIHNCGHAEPPFDQPEDVTPFTPMWQFVLDHPYWLPDGESPWATSVPEALPMWCAYGAGSAEIRTGECPPSAC